MIAITSAEELVINIDDKKNKWTSKTIFFFRDCAIITRRGGGAGKWVKYAPKLSHTPVSLGKN